MVVFDGYMEAPGQEICLGPYGRWERERERAKHNEEEEGSVHFLMFFFIIADEFSVSNNLMKQFVSLIAYYRRKIRW